VSLLRNIDARKLSRKEELALMRRCRQGDQDARDKLVFSILPYAIRFAHKQRANGHTDEDFEQIAMLGVLCAIDSFDPGRGCRLITHATWIMRREFFYVKRRSHLIHTQTDKDPKAIVSLNIEPVDHRRQDGDGFGDIIRAARNLTNREKFILERVFVYGWTLEKISRPLGCTRERVRQIKTKALAKVHRQLGRQLQG
jgi:RNA polymerase sigma factor (sigma-70 family)